MGDRPDDRGGLVAEADKRLGKLIAVYGIAPAYLQRALFVVVLSFLFFLAMMIVYYVRQNAGYFLLASAFLLIYLITLFSWVIQRRNLVKLYELGISFKNRIASWSEIESVNDDGTVTLCEGDLIAIPTSIYEFDKLIHFIRQRTTVSKPAGETL